jgi:hypothetical protein
MAHLAGRVGDGINTPALHPRLREVVAIARDACEKGGRDPARFLVTVFSDLHQKWLDVDSPERADLAALGVDRLILYAGPPFDLALRGVTVR